MTRIIGGDFRGRSIKVPDAEIRPTSSRVREAIFSSVEHASKQVAELDDFVIELLNERVLENQIAEEYDELIENQDILSI